MKYALIALATLSLVSGAVVATGAVTGGDEAGAGVVLEPANTPNGNAYAAIDGSGELAIDLSNLNPSATTLVDSVFTATSTSDQVRLWIESESGAVSFYRSSDRQSIGSPTNAVTLAPGETLDVGLRVETGGSSPGQVDYTVHAAVPQQGGSGGAPPGQVTQETLTEAPPPTTGTPEPEPGTGGPPQTPGQVTETPPDGGTETPTTDEPDQEVGGLPLGPLAALLVALALIAVFLAYRRLRGGPVVRIEADDAGLAVSTGALDPGLYESAEGAVALDLGRTDAWQGGDGGEPISLADAVRVRNTTDAALGIVATADGGTPAGLEVLAGDWATDVLDEGLALDPGEDVALSVRLPADADLGGTATVRVTADPA